MTNDALRMPRFYTVTVPPASGVGIVETLRLENIFDKGGNLTKTRVISYSHGADLASRE